MASKQQVYRILKRKLAESRECTSEVFTSGTATSWAELPTPVSHPAPIPMSTVLLPSSIQPIPSTYPSSRIPSPSHDHFQTAFFPVDDSDSDSDLRSPSEGFKAIGSWVVNYGIRKVAVNDLLGILNRYFDSTGPGCFETLCRPPNKKIIPVFLVSPGEYHHYSIQASLLNLRGYARLLSTEVVLDVGIDGFSWFNSSKKYESPIIGLIVGTRVRPFLIGLYVGDKKPDNIDNLMISFCEEVKILRGQGVLVGDQTNPIKFDIRAFITDTPGRSYPQGILISCPDAICVIKYQ